MNLIEFDNENDYSATIKVIGVGGGGNNAVNSMVRNNIRGVEFIVANTDAQALEKSECPGKIQIGAELTRGLGAGSNPEIGRDAAKESEAALREMLEGTDMAFITAGMGGGTGTGAAPIIARISKEVGALTVGIVTKPFPFERRQRMQQAEEGIMEIKEAVDTLIVIPNQKLLSYVSKQTLLSSAFAMVDDVLQQAVCSISDLVVTPGLINLDFADVKCIMGGMGKALMGSGVATGDARAVEAAQKAVSSPLLDEATVDGAKGILINITGGDDLTLTEVNEASMLIQENAHEDAHIIFGAVIDKKMEGEMRVTVIATGFENADDVVTHKEKPALRKVVGGEPISESNSGPTSFRHLKSLASTIKEENSDSGSPALNLDIPTFLRKHAD